MCDKTDSDIGRNQFLFFCQDYEILQKAELGLPNCLFCGTEPTTIWTTTEICFEHAAHIGFESCGHVVGLSEADVINSLP
ncbi:hypothetical protein SEA_DAUBENSKI_23 [Streptomyces phage Daubenski]|uniref:Uncharacterized protein n=1 Tax=Streptomyces phage Daubenski TaxID=2653725 RepID=A0A5Q2WI28_9CAUD|nr:hypothetical protein KNU80_gp023 [Streptomyces phage Daubenski]QGH76333.1 hypothetical protein SEA_DAUBENSKI_23 [Streptomyces phage Daubenski]